MASIFGRRQKPASNNKKINQMANVSQTRVEATLLTDVIENTKNGVNGASDYHKDSRHSSTFKPQIPPPPTSSTNSSSPTHANNVNNQSNVNKRYGNLIRVYYFCIL